MDNFPSQNIWLVYHIYRTEFLRKSHLFWLVSLITYTQCERWHCLAFAGMTDYDSRAASVS